MSLEEIRDVSFLLILLKLTVGIGAIDSSISYMGDPFLFSGNWFRLGWRDGLDDQRSCWEVVLE
jgi:hypothetical protein